MILGSGAGVALFQDLGRIRWAEDAIEYLVEREVLSNSNIAFNPHGMVTRQEFTVLIVRAFELDMEVPPDEFGDITQNWSYGYVAAAVAAGIVTGFDDENFGPMFNIRRQEMAVILYRAMRYSGIEREHLPIDREFVDSDLIGYWAVDAVNALASLGVIAGAPAADRFVLAPNANASRAEAAVMIYRVLRLM